VPDLHVTVEGGALGAVDDPLTVASVVGGEDEGSVSKTAVEK